MRASLAVGRCRTLSSVLLVAVLGIAPCPTASAQGGDVIGQIASKLSVFKIGDTATSGSAAARGTVSLPTANKEIGELATPRALLKDSPKLQRMLGDNPPFVYDPADRPDPMLIPWTRARVMFKELDQIAQQAIAEKNWPMAEMAYRRMLTLESDEYRQKGTLGLQQLEDLVAQDQDTRLPGSGRSREARLPPWIAANTNGVIVDGDQSMCLVGSFILKVGDIVPRQPVDVTVVKIEPAAVHYKVLDKTFVVKVQEGE